MKILKRKLNGFGRVLADAFFPWDKCLLCGGEADAGGYLCDDCGIRLAAYGRCSVCGCFLRLPQGEPADGGDYLCSYCKENDSESIYIDEYYSALPYADKCREYLLALKYRNGCKYASPLAGHLADCLLHRVPKWLGSAKFERILNADLVVEVPLHKLRLEERGYNQSAILAEVFSARLGVPYVPNVLQRHKMTAVQHRLNAHERKLNTEDAFSPARNGRKVQGKRVILLDDIITGGSTLNNCAKVLKELGAAEVYGVTVASALQ